MTTKKMPTGYGMVQTAIMKSKISIQAKALYSLLASYTGSNDYCFPSIAQLCEDLQLSKPMVIKYLQELESAELIIKSRLYPKDKMRHNHKYEVCYMEKPSEGKPDEPTRESVVNLGGKADLTSNSIIINSISSNNIIQQAEQQPTDAILLINNEPCKTSAQPRSSELYHSILDSFLAYNPTGFDYGREGKAINLIIAKAKDMDNPADYIKTIIETFYSLTKTGNKFWQDQPFLPSVLNAGGIWPRVLLECRKQSPEPEAEEDIDKLFE